MRAGKAMPRLRARPRRPRGSVHVLSPMRPAPSRVTIATALGTKIYFVTHAGDPGPLSDSPFFTSYDRAASWASRAVGLTWRHMFEVKWRRVIA